MSYQDWKPVTLVKSNNDLSKAKRARKGMVTKTRAPGGTNSNNVNNTIIRYDDEGNEIIKAKKPDTNMGRLIQTTRVAKGWTRKHLAGLCNIRDSVMADYETGKVPIPGQHKTLISRRLGLTSLKRKSKSKSKTKSKSK